MATFLMNTPTSGVTLHGDKATRNYNLLCEVWRCGWAKGKLAQDVEVGGHRIRSDEEAEKGGEDTGPAPHELLLAALGSCTAMTFKVYAERKGWPVRDVQVTLNGANGDGGYIITRAGRHRRRSRRRAASAPARDRRQVSRPPERSSGEITIKTRRGEV